ncbi:MAG: sulfotransferase [Candidatus Marinimicrobia bacterium]|nr:sulfotransferase [Candidatus Neomarinimicrobiota bacterium]
MIKLSNQIKNIRKIIEGARKSIRVNFLIAGTQKGGTTALDFYLRKHPKICMAKEKEVHFFDNERIFRMNSFKYAYYHSNFQPNSDNEIIGESTPVYMYWRTAPQRIWKYNPNIKIIIILRNPIERAFSHWNMNKQKNHEKLSFHNAILKERERCRERLPYQHRKFSYIDRGFYTNQIRTFWDFFPRQQMLIIKNEELKYNSHKTLNKIARFLNIDEFPKFSIESKHSRKYNNKISKTDKDRLKNIYEFEIRNLERLLGWDCNDWIA